MSCLSFFAVLCAPLFAFLTHGFLARFVRWPIPRQVTALLACGLGAGLSSTLSFFLLTAGSPSFETVLFIFFLPILETHIYFHVFNMSETARRIKLLTQIYQRKSPAAEDYSPRRLVEIRLERLMQAQQVRVDGDLIYPKKTLLQMVARAMEVYRRILFPVKA